MGLHTQEEISAMAHGLIACWERINQLESALEPFAKDADEYSGWIGNVIVDAGDGDVREAWYTIEDLRRARDLLNP